MGEEDYQASVNSITPWRRRYYTDAFSTHRSRAYLSLLEFLQTYEFFFPPSFKMSPAYLLQSLVKILQASPLVPPGGENFCELLLIP
jgi:hypothetical protein